MSSTDLFNRTQDELKISGFDRLKNSLLNDSMTRFPGHYKGIVTRCKTDVTQPLYVRVKIFGLTDSLPSKAQPWAKGSGSYVPAPGTYVDIVFENGDIHFPIWSNPSNSHGDSLVTKGQKQSNQKNQEVYNSQEGTTLSLDKATGLWAFSHSSGTKFTVDKDGKMAVSANPMGLPLPMANVLTECTICQLTGLPHTGGSPYFKVSVNPVP